ncbi:DUF1405 domain-containing protein [Peptococcaceae bacterium 1198_IL3148]
MLALLKRLWKNPWQQWWFMGILVVINLLGSIYGYYWYRQQLATTEFYFWPVIPDSPLSTTLFGLALLLALIGWRLPILQTLAVTACIKYGIWAVALMSHYWHYHGTVEITEIMLWLSHLGMVIQGIWFLNNLYIPVRAVLVVAVWFLINDAMDYLLGLHPYLFAADQLVFAGVLAVTLTILLLIGILFKCRKYRLSGLI